jgi:hypothetical protein
LARKVFAVRVNSMAEERTVSAFTWLTPPLRSKLAVASMSRMTQIRQYYASEKQHSVSSFKFFVSFLTLLLQLRQKSHPRMKYFEAKAQSKNSSFREPEIAEPADDDTLWPSESGNDDTHKEYDLTARTTSLLNLDSSWLLDVLSEKSSSKDLKGPQVQHELVPTSQASNNNFSLSF